MLTPSQMAQLRQMLAKNNGKPPFASLAVLADDWNVPFNEIARAIADLQGPPTTPSKAQSSAMDLRSFALTRPSAPSAISLDGLEVKPGAIASLPYNWVLANARINSGLAVRDICQACDIAYSDYKKLEEGRLLPTSAQAAKLAYVLKVSLDETFVAAASVTPVKGSRLMRGLSVLGIFRARRRIAVQHLVDHFTERGISLTAIILKKIENGEWRPVNNADQMIADALAAFFGLTSEQLLMRVPPEFLQQAALATRTLHDALKQAYVSLPPSTTAIPLLAEEVAE